MRRNPFCFFHDRYYNAPVEDTFPPLENADAVQVALMQVLNRLRREALRPGALDLRAVNSLLYGLQTAAFNAKRTSFDPAGFRSQIVTDDPLARPDPGTDDDDEEDQPEPALSGAEGAERKGNVSSHTQASRPGLEQMPPAKAGWGSGKSR